MSSPSCPECSSDMVLRTARRGSNAGNQFWGCSSFPRCKGIVNLDTAEPQLDTASSVNVTETNTNNQKIVWYDNLKRENYNSEYITLGSTPHFLGELNLASLSNSCNQFNLLSKKTLSANFDDDTIYIGTILQKLLTRGDLPYCSLGIEETLASQKTIKKSIKKFDKKDPNIGWYWSAEDPFDLKNEMTSNVQRRSISSADIISIKQSTRNIFDSPLEERFFTEWVPNNFGSDALHWFAPQAPLDRLIDASNDEFSARRVDFLFYHL